jgi:hypothetical protein
MDGLMDLGFNIQGGRPMPRLPRYILPGQPHNLYLTLDNHQKARLAVYRDLFCSHIDEKSLDEIRKATQKGWILGCDRFKDNIEQLLQRRTRPLPRGGDKFQTQRG